MFVKFAIDDAAVREGAERALENIDRHEDLVELWFELGVLVFDGKIWSHSKFFSAISSLPVQVRKLWQEYYKANNSRARGSLPLSVFLDNRTDHPVSDIAGEIQVIFSGEELSSEYMRRASEKRCDVEGVEIIRFFSCGRSKTFKDIRALRTREIPAKTKTADIWEHRLKPVAELARSVRVVDAYAIKNCFENRKNAGLKALISNLGKVGKPYELTIYSGRFGYDLSEIEAFLSALVRRTSEDSLRCVELYILEDHMFRKERHSRYLRFDTFICETDKGVAVLDGEELTIPSTYTMKPVEPTHRQSEKDLRYHGEHIVIR